MKKQIYILTLLFLGSLTQLTLADDQVITLKDGSQIKGSLTGIVDGVYTVHTPTLGDVKVNASEVTSISSGAAPAPSAAPAANGALDQKIQSAQATLMNDPAMMQQVQAMAADPELMQLLSDPTLTQAVMAHDVKAIESNPKGQALMNNPKMKALMDQLGSKVNSQ